MKEPGLLLQSSCQGKALTPVQGNFIIVVTNGRLSFWISCNKILLPKNYHNNVKNYHNNVKLNHKDAEGGYSRAEEINCLYSYGENIKNTFIRLLKKLSLVFKLGCKNNKMKRLLNKLFHSIVNSNESKNFIDSTCSSIQADPKLTFDSFPIKITNWKSFKKE